MGSNPGAVYWMDLTFFTFICGKNCIVCLKRLKIKRKRGRGWPIFKKERELQKTFCWNFVGHLIDWNNWWETIMASTQKMVQKTFANILKKVTILLFSRHTVPEAGQSRFAAGLNKPYACMDLDRSIDIYVRTKPSLMKEHKCQSHLYQGRTRGRAFFLLACIHPVHGVQWRQARAG